MKGFVTVEDLQAYTARTGRSIYDGLDLGNGNGCTARQAGYRQELLRRVASVRAPLTIHPSWFPYNSLGGAIT